MTCCAPARRVQGVYKEPSIGAAELPSPYIDYGHITWWSTLDKFTLEATLYFACRWSWPDVILNWEIVRKFYRDGWVGQIQIFGHCPLSKFYNKMAQVNLPGEVEWYQYTRPCKNDGSILMISLETKDPIMYLRELKSIRNVDNFPLGSVIISTLSTAMWLVSNLAHRHTYILLMKLTGRAIQLRSIDVDNICRGWRSVATSISRFKWSGWHRRCW